MQTDIAEFAAKTLLHDLRERVEAAAGIAKAAHVLADAGLIAKGVDVANDIDEEIHEAETLLGLVSAMARSAGATAATNGSHDGPHDAHASESDESGSPIDATLADATIRAFLAQADACLERALGIARAADICVAAGKLTEGVTVALDVEPLLYDARHLVNTASIVKRLTEP